MTQQEISGLCVASLAHVLRISKDRIKTDAKVLDGDSKLFVGLRDADFSLV